MGSTCSAGGRKLKQQLIILKMVVVVVVVVMMMMMATTTCETSGSHSGVGEDSALLECHAVKNDKHLTNFTTMVVPSNPRTSVLGLPDPEITEFPVLRDGDYCLLIGRAQYHRHTVSP